ncbi:hypothetical protein Tco_0902076 [Tanacetum coccineum]
MEEKETNMEEKEMNREEKEIMVNVVSVVVEAVEEATIMKRNGIVTMAYEEVVEEEALMAYEDVIEMKEVVDGSVSFGDEAKVQVKEAGTICFSHTAKQIPTEDEYHVLILNTKSEWCSQNNQNVMMNRGVKVKEEGGDVKVHEKNAWEHKNQNAVDGKQKRVCKQQTLMYCQQTSYERGKGLNSRLNQIRVDMDVDENIG